MKKINIDNFKINDNVLITSYDPPVKARVADMYIIDANMLQTLTPDMRKYGTEIPIFEVFLEDGTLRSFVKDVVKKA
jgi:hypothetical protein